MDDELKKQVVEKLYNYYESSKTKKDFDNFIIWLELNSHKLDFSNVLFCCLNMRLFDIALLLIKTNLDNNKLNIDYDTIIDGWGFLDFMINGNKTKKQLKDYIAVCELLIQLVGKKGYKHTVERKFWNSPTLDRKFQIEYLKKWKELHNDK